MVVGRVGCGLDEERVRAAHVIHDLNEDFLVGEALGIALCQRYVKICRDGFSQRTVRITRDQLHYKILARTVFVIFAHYKKNR